MRKKDNFLKCLDVVIWWFIALLPVFLWGIYIFKNGQFVDFEDCLNSLGFSILTTDNLVYTTLLNIFGNILKMTSSTSFVTLLSWFAIVQIAHLLYDILMILICVAHNLLDKAKKEF